MCFGHLHAVRLELLPPVGCPGFPSLLLRGKPNRREALFLGAWTCAMGASGCDMTYCAYSFCELGNGKFGMYDECEGWDPVKGMPIPEASK